MENLNIYYFPLIVGGIFVFVGVILKIFAPKERSFLFGYRTPSSMKSNEHWVFAQEYSSTKSLQIGLFLWLVVLINFFVDTQYYFSTKHQLILVFIAVLYLFITTEFAICRKFKSVGNKN
ncbi:SdpI family protein [uncultured Polaribacter sp.]|uniref:SdpI family protein n=1 Tax=uncultured Polaribacter sp. TaxID=174711 RepID=UPI0026117061|nr:SdpI family protein [uncultured Polaribacter sp.]